MRVKQLDSGEQEAFWGSYENGTFKAGIIADAVISMASPYLGERVLDIGAGNGALLKALGRRYGDAKSCTGVDMSPRADGIIKADCKNLPFPDASFDTCISTDMIEHLNDSDLDACLSEIARVLKQSGRAIFTTVNRERIEDNVVSCPECQCRFHRWGHCQVFSEERVQTLFPTRGLSVVMLRTLNFGLLTKYGLLVRAAYALGVDRWYRTETFNSDLFFVVRKH